MSGLAGWTVEAMIASALLMAVVLLARGVVRRQFGPQIAYALWALPLLRLVLPPLPRGWHAAATPIAAAGETIVMIVGPAGPAAASPGIAAMLIPLLVIAWAVGAAGFLGYHIATHRRFCRRILSGAVARERGEGVDIVTSAAAPGPLAFGIWRRYVAFPIDFAERYDADERSLALAHEIGHHQRGDLIANWVALAVLALHWFNPLAWRAFRAFRADQELANDARVLAGRSGVDRHAYACAIVKAAHGGAVSAACHLHTITDLKGRLKMLSLSPASRRRLASGGAAVGALAIAGLGLTASGSSARAISAGVTEAVQQAAAPVPPAVIATDKDPTSVLSSSTDARKVKRVVVVKDGKTETYEGAKADAYLAAHPMPDVPMPPGAGGGPHAVRKVVIVRDGKTTVSDKTDIDGHLAAGDNVSIRPLEPGSSRMIVKDPNDPDGLIEVQDIPAIKAAKCGIGSGKPTSLTLDTTKGERRMIVICTDRIQRVALADGMVTAGNSRDIERNAYSRALTGLIDARARMVANADMSAADRARALTAIDQSITEIKGQLARFK